MTTDQTTLWQRLLYFLNPVDGRFEDLKKGNVWLNIFRDMTAGLIVAMVAIPLAMGFAMASGLQPEQGIVGGAVAGLVGALFGGSKYQVYGPTAAYIPILCAIMDAHDHTFLVLCSGLAGLVLMVLGLTRFGRVVNLVPHSIVVGFTIGIAFTIAFSQVDNALGLHSKLGTTFFQKVNGIFSHLDEFNLYALVLALMVFLVTKGLLRVSIFIPAPLIAVAVGTLLTETIWNGKGLPLVHTKYGEIPEQMLTITPHSTAGFQYPYALAYYVVAIVFVAAIESLLCSRMADRLANNQGLPFNPDKELWGQGLVQILVPFFNGFPHTGALARTATNIKLGALSPLAGIFKFFFKLMLAFYMASWLEKVPMACIAGILLFVSSNMVKPSEVTEVKEMGKFHRGLMWYTAIAVILTDFLTGVLSALVISMLRTLTHAEVKVRPEEGYWRVDVLGSLTFVSSGKVIRSLNEMQPHQHMVLDLHLHFMDMVGWKNLMDWCAEYRRQGGQVELHALMDPV